MKHILAAIGLLIGGLSTVKYVWDGYRQYGLDNVPVRFVQSFTSYNIETEDFDIKSMKFLPGYVGIGGSYVAAKSGVNKWTPKGANL